MDSDDLITIDNYNIVRNNSLSRHTGGVLMYLKKNWSYKVIKSFSLGLRIWWLVVKVYNANNTFIVVTIYRAPGYINPNDDFYKYFKLLIEELAETKQKVLIVGDFNINWLVNNKSKSLLSELISDNGFNQIVHNYTRITNVSRTLIDYVLVNDKYNISANVDSNIKISDHESIVINLSKDKNLRNEEKKIKFLKYNKNRFRSKIVHSDIMTTYYLDCNNKAEIFNNSLQNIINDFIVIKKQKTGSCEWYSDDLSILKNNKIKQYKISVLSNSLNDWQKYKVIRNNYKNKLNSVKNAFISNKIDYASDQKAMWKSIKKFVLKKHNSEIKEIKFGNEVLKNSVEIANRFNNYFIESVELINKTIPIKQYKNFIPITNTRFKSKQITIDELKLILKSLNNKKDMNFCNIGIIIDSIDLIGENLLSIINLSIESGTFPDSWKESLVIPIEKVKNTILCNEFRPVNMISTISKILEKVMYNQLEVYFDKNCLMSQNQSGFRKNHSCESLLNLVLTNWKIAIDDKKVVVAVFLDLRRAFETVDRDILLNKLLMYGVQDRELVWFESYLMNRTQRTKVEGVVSDLVDVKLGVPQGTILGVLLFLIYVNDMEKVVKLSNLALFADDTLIYVVGDSVDECTSKLNEDLSRLGDWFMLNKLKLNIEKTKCMVVNSILNNKILIDNVEIDLVNEIKYLGLVIDSSLSFKSHLEYICKKINKKLYFFSKIRKNLSVLSAIKIFNVMIRPHFEYCSSILFMFNAEMMNRLQKLQNRGMRIILKVSRYTSKSHMLRTLKWMSVSQRIKMNVLIMVFKIKHKIMPSYLTDRLTYVEDVQHYYLRNIWDFRLNFFNKSKTQNMLMYNGLKLFNNLPVNLKMEKNFLKYKKGLLKYVNETFD